MVEYMIQHVYMYMYLYIYIHTWNVILPDDTLLIAYAHDIHRPHLCSSQPAPLLYVRGQGDRAAVGSPFGGRDSKGPAHLGRGHGLEPRLSLSHGHSQIDSRSIGNMIL